jgi:hypothetical protein
LRFLKFRNDEIDPAGVFHFAQLRTASMTSRWVSVMLPLGITKLKRHL